MENKKLKMENCNWETEVSRVIEIFCDKYCRFPVMCFNQDILDEHCDSCDLIKLFNIGASEKGGARE